MKRGLSLKQRMREHPEYWYFLFIPGFLAAFFLMEHLVPSGCDYWVSWCPLDDRIPFFAPAVIPYCMWYPLLLVTGLLLMFRDVPQLKKYAWFLIIGFGFSIVFCILFPNGQDLRPETFAEDNIFTRLLTMLYAADTNTNVLPSMHVIGCVAADVAIFHSEVNRRWRWPILLVSLMIIASTVLVKQHSVLDVFAGFAVCAPLWLILYRKKK